MLLPLVFALVAPASFVHAVQTRLVDERMHLVDWWADDLDRDRIPESIAFVCNDDAGLFLVQHGRDLLEAALVIDGRNGCPEAPPRAPAWLFKKSGVIQRDFYVHHGAARWSYAVRDGHLVVVREDVSSWDITHRREFREESHVDYDQLTWSSSVEESKRREQTSGVLVLVMDRARRVTTLIGKSTLRAFNHGGQTTLRFHADRALVVRDCRTPCTSTWVAKGDREISIPPVANEIDAGKPPEIEVLAGDRGIVVRFCPLGGDVSYPALPLGI
jgi:hypothetical protein